IAKTLDGIHTLRSIENDDFDMLAKVKMLKENLERLDMIENGRIDNLIRDNKIDPKMATSLINDSTYAYNISKRLIEVSITLWIKEKEIRVLTGDES
ncbi:MAG: Na/Pi cotransporter family protein, partial [Campylobacterota bacterium]|nr:Na/Pi cotransporter family protein [Campylobacterota bacterium]